jgi:hypothetical protein
LQVQVSVIPYGKQVDFFVCGIAFVPKFHSLLF